MANHPNRSKIARYGNIMHYKLDGEYMHEHPESLAHGQPQYRGSYEVTWSAKQGFLVYFGTSEAQQLIVNKSGNSRWLKTKDYDQAPEFARVRFLPDDGELERIGAV